LENYLTKNKKTMKKKLFLIGFSALAFVGSIFAPNISEAREKEKNAMS
jgi:hypothetical protein